MKRSKKIIGLILTVAVMMMFSCGVQASAFTDVNNTDWFAAAVDYCFDKGYIRGTSTTTFSPDKAMNRAMLVTILYRCAGEPAVEIPETATFSDIEANLWYEKAVIWGSRNGLVSGYPDGTFRPYKEVNRQELMTFIYRYMKFCGKAAESEDARIYQSFPDYNQVESWAEVAVKWCTATGIIGGSDGKIEPTASSTRAQIAIVLKRMDCYLADDMCTLTVSSGTGGTVKPAGTFTLVKGVTLTLRVVPDSFYIADAYYYDGVASAVNSVMYIPVKEGNHTVTVTFRKISGDYRSGYGQLVNRSYPIANAASYHPSDLKACLYPQSGYETQYMRADAADAVNQMTTDCRKATGKAVYNRSGYRSNATQVYLYNRQISRQGGNQYKAGTISAIPGTSEHETGLAMDISTGGGLTEDIAYTEQGKWLAAHCYEYGFIIRYPAGSETICGIIFEPWHFRYVGVTIATEMKTMGVSTLEEYYGLYLNDDDITPYLPYLQ